MTSSVTGTGTLTHWEIAQKSSTDTDYGSFTDLTAQTSTSLSHTVSGLDNAKTYRFKVRAVNGTGDSADSAESVAVSPAAATLTVSNVEDDTATLTIGSYAHANGWYHKHTVPTTGGTCSAKQTSAAASLSLSGNTSYTFKAYSDSTCATELATASAFLTKPGQPTTPVAATAGSGKLLVTSSVTGTGTLTHWEIAQKSSTDTDYGSFTDLTAQTTTSLSHVVSGLDNAKTYRFKVRAVNGTGDSADSAESVAVSPAAATLTVSNVEDDTATLTIGSYAHANGWYHKYTMPATGGTCSAKQTAAAASPSLAGNTSYTFKAYSDSGCATELATATAFLTKPGQPTTPVAATAGSGKLLVTSSVTGGGTLTHWEIAQKSSTDTDYGSFTDLTAQTTTSLSHVVSGLDNAKTYRFKVRAVNATGDSADSAESVAVSPAAATLTVSNVEDDTATLTIGDYAHANGWYHKHTVPTTGGTCSAKQTTAAASPSLSGNTSYTFKAYSDSGCSTELATASAFLTKPGQPDQAGGGEGGQPASCW